MNWNDSITDTQPLRSRIAYTGSVGENLISINLRDDFQIDLFADTEQLNEFLKKQTLFSTPEIIMMEIDGHNAELVFKTVKKIKETPLTCGLIIILVALNPHPDQMERAKRMQVHDYYRFPFDTEELNQRLKFLIKFKLIKSEIQNLSYQTRKKYTIPMSKRVFDILVSSLLLLGLSPLLFLIALLIRLESKGPVIYKSKRAGTGYKIFDFYKFRSMVTDAEKQLEKLSPALNQYATGDGHSSTGSAFVKLKDDPRITKLGKILRKTSLDELPQLFNVLLGDMSIVGNRPLPLYEAEQLTSNEWSTRFLGPAGITGLWQISKRGKSEMSELERKQLDNYYVKHSSMLFDLKIIAKTIPALFQKENV